jgi:ABC-type lipoprotein export system ATPase subunit
MRTNGHCKGIAADNGAGVLLVTHEIEAAEYADEVYTMDSGKLSREA